MTDDISKVVMRVLQCPRCPTGVETQAAGTVECLRCGAEMEVDSSAKVGIESATTPAEVDVPTIDRDEPLQRDYIPLGRSGWEIQTKGKGSTYRLCEPDGHRLAIPNEPYLHETLTRMARDVHADYATLARQLAEAKAEIAALSDDVAEYQRNIDAESFALTKAESALAAATRRVAEAEADARRWRTMMACDELRSGNGTLLFKRQAGVETYERAVDRFQSTESKEPTK